MIRRVSVDCRCDSDTSDGTIVQVDQVDRTMTHGTGQQHDAYLEALAAIWDRSGYDRGFISNPFAGDEAARLGLRRTQAVLDALDNPERALPLVHVAGSKGKGSTVVLIDAILRAAGKLSGRFTSPHLHTFRERFIVDGEPIGEVAFAGLTSEVLEMARSVEAAQPQLGQLTSFELATAMALRWFAKARCDVAVIEVGLGGTLDATNVIDPVVSAITRLDLEHTAILGDTLAEIAGNKAGIIKPGRPGVTVRQEPEAMAVIEARARETGSPLLVQGRHWTVAGDEDGFAVSGPWGTTAGLRASLVGAHQVENAALAVVALKTAEGIGAISDDAIRSGLLAAVHPGRFERVTAHDGTTVVIDGAHTPIAASVLADALTRHLPGPRPTIVVGMLRDKHPADFLEPLAATAGRWIVAEPQTPRAMPAGEIIEALRSLGQEADHGGSVADAISMALLRGDPVVVTGSLTTVAEARVALGLAAPDPSPGGMR
jgi:dihydrofolate synthase/folylpolyglutamate synthase